MRRAEVIAGLVDAGIPVMAHCGLCPQSVHQLGGYRVQRNEEQLWADAEAGATGRRLRHGLGMRARGHRPADYRRLEDPTIGIGAGAGCDGQVLVLHDLLGLGGDHVPRHVKAYANLKSTIGQAVRQYRDEVRQGVFPALNRPSASFAFSYCQPNSRSSIMRPEKKCALLSPA